MFTDDSVTTSTELLTIQTRLLEKEGPIPLNWTSGRNHPSATISIRGVHHWVWIHQRLTSLSHLTAIKWLWNWLSCIISTSGLRTQKIGFWSRSVLSAYEYYSASKWELFYLVWALKTLIPHTWNIHFLYRPHHSALFLNDRWRRRVTWQLRLAEF